MIYHSIFECEYDRNVERLVREFMVCREYIKKHFAVDDAINGGVIYPFSHRMNQFLSQK